MKRVTVLAKVLLAAAAVAGIATYAVVMEIGLHAGEIHPGVTVDGRDLGGLTPAEATEELTALASRNAHAEIVFVAPVDGVEPFVFTPSEFQWEPKIDEISEAAYSVGRTGGFWKSLRARLRAYTSGVEIEIEGFLDFDRVHARLDVLAGEAEDAGYRLQKGKLVYRMKQAIDDWPKKDSYRLPLAGGD